MEIPKAALTKAQKSEFLEMVCTQNNLLFNTAKVLEEMHETGEVLMKMITKSTPPPIEKVVEELGDLLCRVVIFEEHLIRTGAIGDDSIRDRYESKMAWLYEHLKSGKGGTKIERVK